MRFTFNSPFILWFTMLAAASLLLQDVLGIKLSAFILSGTANFSSFSFYLSTLLYPLSHGDWSHLMGNFAIILLLGPILEKKYGWKALLGMTLGTTLLIAIVHIIFSNHQLIGASGIVFMYIVMASLLDRKSNEIPLTFLLVAILYLGREIMGIFYEDQISQLAHLVGGAAGMAWVLIRS